MGNSKVAENSNNPENRYHPIKESPDRQDEDSFGSFHDTDVAC